jgi:hypothetical protein
VFYVIPYVGFLLSMGAFWLAFSAGDQAGFVGIEMSMMGEGGLGIVV